MNSEPRVVASDRLRHSLHRRLELRMSRVDVEPFLQHIVRRQWLELSDNRGVMRVFGADQDAVPFPAARLGWFHQHQHLPAEQIDGEPTEHPLREKGLVDLERFENPLVVERSHSTASYVSSARRRQGRTTTYTR